ncbi:MAG TPA: DUF1003 domain-containing protein [Ramlibacter sp.]|jgi:uncharacterized membrane protein|uniref:DUF1003 domain-containing protein n=1 Tax=Ramlibacter sp. TaxID=1917967 RepID=UPI002D3B9B8A|nr:DUF1003 domain-containing protein [Ramlibacter sp.]HZY17916.1 DUF1003 domain-containing protein [Ramlibacter sp.]
MQAHTGNRPRLDESARSVADVTRANVQAMRQLDQLETARSSLSDKFADLVARACGHIGFSIGHAVGFAGWMVWNTWFASQPPDPYPFTLLTLWASAEGIFLMSFVLISQNYQMRVSERRNQLDLQINLLAEQENSKMLLLLENIAKKVGALHTDDPEVGVLVQATEPDTLAQQIDDAYREQDRQDERT